jgi:hypothetical protein
MERVEVTYDKALRVWWSYLWRSILYAVLGAIVLGFGVALLISESESGEAVSSILGALWGALASIWVLKNNILSKKYKTFSVALIKEESD